jgi:hypothetical protein
MVIPESVARFNAHETNRVSRLLDASDLLSTRPAPTRL